MMKTPTLLGCALLFASASLLPLHAQVGRRFPSEKKVVPDPVTGVPLTFLTNDSYGNSKIYPTHLQWTADGKWVIFRSNRVPGQAFAVNEESGDIVQLTEKGYLGMLCSARHSMKLYIMRDTNPAAQRGFDREAAAARRAAAANNSETPEEQAARRREFAHRPHGPFQIIEIDLAKLFADSASGAMKADSEYERVCGTLPAGINSGGNMGLDANEDTMYFNVTGDEVAKRLPAGEKPAEPFGPRGMGAGPTGLASMNLKTGEFKFVVTVPFQIGHVQTNPWVPGEIVFCWETGGKAPTRMWTVRADGTGLRPVYPEQPFEWITHEAVITKDEVAFAMIALRKPVVPDAAVDPGVPVRSGWGPAGIDDHPTGLAIVNLRTREMRIISQVPTGNPGRSFWHVNGSADGRWATADDFMYRVWLIDRHTGETILLADDGHVKTAADHQHPTFSPDGTKIEVQSAMLSPDHRSLNICIIPVPKSWLARTYPEKIE